MCTRAPERRLAILGWEGHCECGAWHSWDECDEDLHYDRYAQPIFTYRLPCGLVIEHRPTEEETPPGLHPAALFYFFPERHVLLSGSVTCPRCREILVADPVRHQYAWHYSDDPHARSDEPEHRGVPLCSLL